MHAPVFWPPPSLKTRRIRRNHPQKKEDHQKKGDEIFSLLGSSKMHFATSSSRWREPSQMTLSIQKFQDPASCLTCVWTSCVISVWIVSESSSEFLSEFLSEIFLSFVWILSEICLNFVWIFVSEFCQSFQFSPCFIVFWSIQTCLKFVGICLNFVLNLVGILVWILSEFLSNCLNVWILFQLYLSFGPVWGAEKHVNEGRQAKQLRKETQLWATNFCNRSISPMAMQKRTPGQERSSGIFSRTGAAKKLKNPQKPDWPKKGPSGFF